MASGVLLMMVSLVIMKSLVIMITARMQMHIWVERTPHLAMLIPQHRPVLEAVLQIAGRQLAEALSMGWDVVPVVPVAVLEAAVEAEEGVEWEGLVRKQIYIEDISRKIVWTRI